MNLNIKNLIKYGLVIIATIILFWIIFCYYPDGFSGKCSNYIEGFAETTDPNISTETTMPPETPSPPD